MTCKSDWRIERALLLREELQYAFFGPFVPAVKIRCRCMVNVVVVVVVIVVVVVVTAMAVAVVVVNVMFL